MTEFSEESGVPNTAPDSIVAIKRSALERMLAMALAHGRNTFLSYLSCNAYAREKVEALLAERAAQERA